MDTAQDTLTDAKEALSEFEIFVGDGTIYSDYDGTIMSVGYEAGDDLSAGTSIVTFADTRCSDDDSICVRGGYL